MGKDKEFDAICYKRNFLDRVIFRIDFLSEISDQEFNSQNLIKAIMEFFPVMEKDKVLHESTIQFKVSEQQRGEISSGTTNLLLEKSFTDNERTKTFKYSKKYLIIEIFIYDQFRNFIEYISKIVESIEQKVSIRRIGIRYINIFNLDKNIKLDINEYFNKKLLSFSFFDDIDNSIISLSRALNIQEYLSDNNNLKFQYGLYNPDYPAKLKKNAFVLDYDSFCQGLIEDNNEIIPKVTDLHYLIQYLFEKSISDKLKEELNKDE